MQSRGANCIKACSGGKRVKATNAKDEINYKSCHCYLMYLTAQQIVYLRCRT